MPPISSCLTGCAAGGPSASAATGPNISTSIYETHLGFASFTWSRTFLGLSLNASVHFAAVSSDDYHNDSSSSLHFEIHPWLFWKRKGSRRLHLNISRRSRIVYIAWNLTRARFPPAGSPEPSSGFFIAVSIDGEVVLVAGDLSDEAHRKMKAKRRSPTMPVSRSEHVVLKGRGRRRMGSYRSAVRIGGADREIGIEIDGGMSVTADGKKILHVRRVRWNFRGSQRVEIGDGGGAILISWDLQPWFFPVKESASAASAPSAAIFVFCFERKEGEGEISRDEVMRIKNGCGGMERDWYLGRKGNWGEGSGCGGAGGGFEWMKVRKKSLLKTCSSSSSFSSASSAASSSVMDWWSSEEAEMRGVDGFTLVVYAWKA